jgi:uncharacterized protein YbjT (DUF2867 family)
MKLIEYDGVVNALAEAERLGFGGRFLYMTASGIGRRSVLAACLNLYKGNTLLWRRRAEAAIRKSPVDYPIVRAGMLVNRRSGTRAIRLVQEALRLSICTELLEAMWSTCSWPRSAKYVHAPEV